MESLPEPFADWCNVTLAPSDWERVVDDVLGVCREVGGFEVADDRMNVGRGVLKYAQHERFGLLSFSGEVLARLRGGGLLSDVMLRCYEAYACVTQLHVCLDVARDGAAEVRRLYRRALGKRGVMLTRKAIPQQQVRRIARPAHIDGRETGTVYLGSRKRDVRCKVYDKRNELLDRVAAAHGLGADVLALNDPGPLTRYELELGRKVGSTIWDVLNPGSIFWHFMSDVLEPPSEVEPWEPGRVGAKLPPLKPPDYGRQLDMLIERSHDIRRACELSDKLGRHGRAYLVGRIERYSVGNLVRRAPSERIDSSAAASEAAGATISGKA